MLAIQDTTVLNYSRLVETTGLGDIGGNKNVRGLIAHSTIAVLPDGLPLGLLDQNIWGVNRKMTVKRKTSRPGALKKKKATSG